MQCPAGQTVEKAERNAIALYQQSPEEKCCVTARTQYEVHSRWNLRQMMTRARYQDGAVSRATVVVVVKAVVIRISVPRSYSKRLLGKVLQDKVIYTALGANSIRLLVLILRHSCGLCFAPDTTRELRIRLWGNMHAHLLSISIRHLVSAMTASECVNGALSEAPGDAPS